MALDPRIGKLSNGKFYAFTKGHNRPEFIGDLEEVEEELGLRPKKMRSTVTRHKLWTVTIRFDHPAWDEVDGIEYHGILAATKSEANKIARRKAENDGHVSKAKGRCTFTAIEEN